MKNNSKAILCEIDNSFNNFFNKSSKEQLEFSVALSGGIDSIVLLHSLNQLKTRLKFKLSAIHIHHDLSLSADDWLNFCHNECNKLSIPIKSKRVNIKQDLSMGVEAAARKSRYQALESNRKGTLVLGHHQNDQAETLLLQLFRGSGLSGLAAMAIFDQERFIWRPLLKINREMIEGYAKENNLNFIEDESNNNLKFDRNFLRKEILPLIQSRYPDIINVISRSSENIAEGLNLHKAIAKEDANFYFSKDKERLSLSMIKVLEKERVINLVRWWLDVNKQLMPSKKTMHELYKQIKNVKKDALLNIDISELMSIKAYRDELFLVEKVVKIDPYELIWRGEEIVKLPGNSKLIFKKSLGTGFSLSKIGSKTLTIQNRNGGESFKPKNNQPTRTLKYLLQTSNIPPWKRQLMPLVFSENELVAVPDFGIHYQFQTDKEEYGWDINWVIN